MIAAALLFVGVNAAFFGGLFWWFRRHPIEAFVASTRRRLRNAGLKRRVGPDGIVYWTGGPATARPLVLLHGVNDQAGTWCKVAPHLVGKFRLIIPDLPTHGESEPKSGAVPLPLIVERVAALIDHEVPGREVTLVGNSMGGWVSVLYAARHPERVERLVLESGSGMEWDVSHLPVFPKTKEDVVRLLRAANGPRSNPPQFMIDAILRVGETPMERVMKGGYKEHAIDSLLPRLTMPTTLIWGADDGVLPLDYAEALHAKIPGSRLEVIPGAAHIPHRQKPEEFVRCLMATF